tara:strand:- start:340 stop:540 length:201 start_codon:yes stop_codon:yes gene_type:complete
MAIYILPKFTLKNNPLSVNETFLKELKNLITEFLKLSLNRNLSANLTNKKAPVKWVLFLSYLMGKT